MYVDDLITGGENVKAVAEKRSQVVEVFEDGTFKLHKWYSNDSSLESNDLTNEDELIFAKEQLGSNKHETKLLGLPWNKIEDTVSIGTSPRESISTKREALSELAKVYDPLSLVASMTLVGKILYREMCGAKVPRDGELTETMKQRWKEWGALISEKFTLPRTLAPLHQPITAVTLRTFGDASKSGVSSVVHAKVQQGESTTQGLVCAKSRLSKQNLTIPRLELVAAHMATNLVTNVGRAIGRYKVIAIHCWSDSTVALYWINGQGEYRQFVSNRVRKIRDHGHIEWHYVPTEENPADIGSRGGSSANNVLWTNGPEWLSDPEKWPTPIVIGSSSESNAEAKVTKRVLTTTIEHDDDDVMNAHLQAHSLRKVIRIGAWMRRFVDNLRRPVDERDTGPLKTAEIEHQYLWWTRRAQHDAKVNGEFEKSKVQLNIQSNDEGILECRGRIEGEYPVFLTQNHLFTGKLVEHFHLSTLHGGVGLTMAKVRDQYWVPKLRQLVKRVRSECWGCKRFQV